MTSSLRQRFDALTPSTKGMWLGLCAMALFGLTLPMTRLAIGSNAAPQLSPWFVTFGRAVVAAMLSIAVLVITRSPWPNRQQWRALIIAALGNAIGYPLLLAFALRSVTASHAAVITALLPLVTALAAAWTFKQRVGRAFWMCASAGTILVILYSLLRSSHAGSGFQLDMADLLLVAAVLAASVGYVQGALVTPALGAERVICWVTVISLPVTLPGALLTWPSTPVTGAAWAGFAYVGLFSMWVAFFAWYRALALGGSVRVSQVQLLQPFFAMLFSVPLLGERLDALTIGFGTAVVFTVYLGKKLSAAS
jgi:drug/metabolite transporter (DMT)-like permease